MAFALPVMITCQVAEQSVPVFFSPCSVMLQRSISRTGCFAAGSVDSQARSPTLEFWASLRPLLEHFHHIELRLSGSHATLGRSRVQVRDVGHVLSGLARASDRRCWMTPSGNIWGSQVPLRVLEWEAVFQSLVLGWTCSGFVLLRNCLQLHLALSSLPCAPLLSRMLSFHQVLFCRQPRDRFQDVCVDLLRAQANQVLTPQPALWDTRFTDPRFVSSSRERKL